MAINDHEKYEGHTLEDRFISASVNALAKELEQENKFLMLKVTDKWNEIPNFASMWNMEGMVLIGFCEQDYQKLREQMHIAFVVYDGYMERYQGLKSVLPDAKLMIIPMEQEKRTKVYREHLEEIKTHSAVFAVSDYYAMDFILFLNSVSVSVPEDISVIGFDDVRECKKFVPPLTTIKQDYGERAVLCAM